MSFNLKTNDEFKVAAVVVRRFSVVLFSNETTSFSSPVVACLTAWMPGYHQCQPMIDLDISSSFFQLLPLLFCGHVWTESGSSSTMCSQLSLSPLLISFSFVTVELLCCRIVCLSISFVVCRNYRFIWLSNCPTATRRCTHILFPIVVVFILSLWCRCVLSSYHHRSLSLAI